VCAQREKLILFSSPFTNNRQIQNHTERDRQENTEGLFSLYYWWRIKNHKNIVFS
jgi:hypothetical protein